LFESLKSHFSSNKTHANKQDTLRVRCKTFREQRPVSPRAGSFTIEDSNPLDLLIIEQEKPTEDLNKTIGCLDDLPEKVRRNKSRPRTDMELDYDMEPLIIQKENNNKQTKKQLSIIPSEPSVCTPSSS
jgi:hypothetical protein